MQIQNTGNKMNYFSQKKKKNLWNFPPYQHIYVSALLASHMTAVVPCERTRVCLGVFYT